MDALNQSIQSAQDSLNDFLGVTNQPSTEELGLTQQYDQLELQIDRLKEAGTSQDDAQLKSLTDQASAIKNQISAYEDERKTIEDLAKATGDLRSGMTNSIEVQRQAGGQIASLEEAYKKLSTTTTSFYGQATSAAQGWASATVSAVGQVGQAFLTLTSHMIAAKFPDADTAIAGGTTTQGTGGSQAGGIVSRYGSGNSGTVGIGETSITVGKDGTIPSYDLGGRVPVDGLIFAHAGETVLPPGLNVGQPAQPLAAGALAAPSITFAPGSIVVNGTNLSQPQLEQAIVGAGRRLVNDYFSGRAGALQGQRV